MTFRVQIILSLRSNTLFVDRSDGHDSRQFAGCRGDGRPRQLLLLVRRDDPSGPVATGGVRATAGRAQVAPTRHDGLSRRHPGPTGVAFSQDPRRPLPPRLQRLVPHA